MTKRTNKQIADQYVTNQTAIQAMIGRVQSLIADGRSQNPDGRDVADSADIARELAGLVRRLENYKGDDDDYGTGLLAKLGVKA